MKLRFNQGQTLKDTICIIQQMVEEGKIRDYEGFRKITFNEKEVVFMV